MGRAVWRRIAAIAKALIQDKLDYTQEVPFHQQDYENLTDKKSQSTQRQPGIFRTFPTRPRRIRS
jgi:hypothetical protein